MVLGRRGVVPCAKPDPHAEDPLQPHTPHPTCPTPRPPSRLARPSAPASRERGRVDARDARRDRAKDRDRAVAFARRQRRGTLLWHTVQPASPVLDVRVRRDSDARRVVRDRCLLRRRSAVGGSRTRPPRRHGGGLAHPDHAARGVAHCFGRAAGPFDCHGAVRHAERLCELQHDVLLARVRARLPLRHGVDRRRLQLDESVARHVRLVRSSWRRRERALSPIRDGWATTPRSSSTRRSSGSSSSRTRSRSPFPSRSSPTRSSPWPARRCSAGRHGSGTASSSQSCSGSSG